MAIHENNIKTILGNGDRTSYIKKRTWLVYYYKSKYYTD